MFEESRECENLCGREGLIREQGGWFRVRSSGGSSGGGVLTSLQWKQCREVHWKRK